LHPYLGNKEACPTSLLNLLFSQLGEVLRLHNNRHSDLTGPQQLEVPLGHKVYYRGLATPVLGSLVHTLARHVEQVVDVECRTMLPVAQDMELAHTDLTEVTRMVLVEEDAVMVLTTGITTTSRMLTVLSDTTVTGGHVSPLFPVLVVAGGHGCWCLERRTCNTKGMDEVRREHIFGDFNYLP